MIPPTAEKVAPALITPARNVLTVGWAFARRGPDTAASQTD